MPKTAAKPQASAAIFAPQKRSHLHAVQTPKQRQRLYDEIDQNVREIVHSDEDAYALAFLIDIVTGIYLNEYSLGGDRASDLPQNERMNCASRILEFAFTQSPSHSTAMIAWLGLEDAQPVKKVKAG